MLKIKKLSTNYAIIPPVVLAVIIKNKRRENYLVLNRESGEFTLHFNRIAANHSAIDLVADTIINLRE